MPVVMRHEGLDGRDQIGDALEDAPAELLGRQLAEPPLDEIQPRAARRDEVEVEARMADEPLLDRRVLVGGVSRGFICTTACPQGWSSGASWATGST